jgi:hypothetical protein
MSIKHPLRKLSNENWKRYGKIRYKIGHRFCSMKQKIGSSFKLLREDLAQKSIHCLCYCLELLGACNLLSIFVISIWYLVLQLR